MLEQITATFDKARVWVNEPKNATAVFATGAVVTGLAQWLSQEPILPKIPNMFTAMTGVAMYKALTPPPQPPAFFHMGNSKMFERLAERWDQEKKANVHSSVHDAPAPRN